MQNYVEKQLTQINNRVKFLSSVLSGDIKVIYRKRKELFQEFREKGFDPLPKEWDPVAIGAAGEKEENEKSAAVDDTDYDYLMSMTISSLNEEYLDHLLILQKRFEAEKRKFEIELERKAAPEYLRSENQPSLFDANHKKSRSDREIVIDKSATDSKVYEAARKRRRGWIAGESLEKKLRTYEGIGKSIGGNQAKPARTSTDDVKKSCLVLHNCASASEGHRDMEAFPA